MSEAFEPVFQALREIMLRHAGGLMVVRDAPGEFVAHTQNKDGKGAPGWFGAVMTKKTYVAYHLPPLYDHPALTEGLSPDLARRRQGKTCFNFKRIEPPLFEELDRLTFKTRRAIRADAPPRPRRDEALADGGSVAASAQQCGAQRVLERPVVVGFVQYGPSGVPVRHA